MIIIIINDIYTGSSTHPKVVFREVLHPIKLEFGNVDFWGEGKTGEPGEKALRARKRTNNKLNPHMTPGPVIEPGTHSIWWKASVLTTAPSLQCKVKFWKRELGYLKCKVEFHKTLTWIHKIPTKKTQTNRATQSIKGIFLLDGGWVVGGGCQVAGSEWRIRLT